MLTSRMLSIVGPAIALALHTGSPLAQANDAPPTTPTGLESDAYGITSGEVRWQRSSDDRGAVAGYEVTRDGAVLGVFDALSVVQKGLSPGTTYLYGITAIDNAGQRSGEATIELTTQGGSVVGDTLAAPAGLRSEVYSRTAAELFWGRPAAFGLIYEVSRNGELITTTEGISYYDDTLSATTTYGYEVVAINRQGRRSEPATLQLTTDNGSRPIPAPGAPDELRADVYSSTAAELFWARTVASGFRYEIVRNGEPVATTNGTSFFDDSLRADTTYRYAITAIDPVGLRSSPASVELTTSSDPGGSGEPVGPGDGPSEPPTGNNSFAQPDPDAASILARLGYPAARELADEFVSASYLSLFYDIESALGEFLSSNANFSSTSPSKLVCPGGGELRGIVQPFLRDLEFDNCVIDGRTLSGALLSELEFIVFGAGSRQENIITFDDLVIDAGVEGVLRLSGTSQRNDSAAAENTAQCGGAQRVVRRVDNSIDSARLEHDGTLYIIEDARWEQDDVVFPGVVDNFGREPCVSVEALFVDGTARVQSAVFGQNAARFDKNVDITRDPRDGALSLAGSARLAAVFGDGSTLVVSAIAGNHPDTAEQVQVDILAKGVSVSFNEDYRFEAREDIPTIIGR